jgi:hypothetical protein
MPSSFVESRINQNLEVATEYFKALVSEGKKDSNDKLKQSAGSLGFIPYNISFTMDGIGGIKIYNELSLDTSFLPAGYTNTTDFIVTGVDHKIANGDWETNVNVTLIPRTSPITNVITSSLKIFGQVETAPVSAPTTIGAAAPLTGGDNVEKALKFFIDQKAYPKWKAAGIVAAIMGESGGKLNPQAVNPTSNAFGIAQWLGTRRTKLAQVSPGTDTTLEGQLTYLYAELQPGSGYTDSIADGYIAQATNAEEMLAAMATFERWGYPVSLFNNNGKSYQKVYEIMKQESISANSPDKSFRDRIAYLTQVKDLIKKLYGSYA